MICLILNFTALIAMSATIATGAPAEPAAVFIYFDRLGDSYTVHRDGRVERLRSVPNVGREAEALRISVGACIVWGVNGIGILDLSSQRMKLLAQSVSELNCSPLYIRQDSIGWDRSANDPPLFVKVPDTYRPFTRNLIWHPSGTTNPDAIAKSVDALFATDSIAVTTMMRRAYEGRRDLLVYLISNQCLIGVLPDGTKRPFSRDVIAVWTVDGAVAHVMGIGALPLTSIHYDYSESRLAVDAVEFVETTETSDGPRSGFFRPRNEFFIIEPQKEQKQRYQFMPNAKNTKILDVDNGVVLGISDDKVVLHILEGDQVGQSSVIAEGQWVQEIKSAFLVPSGMANGN